MNDCLIFGPATALSRQLAQHLSNDGWSVQHLTYQGEMTSIDPLDKGALEQALNRYQPQVVIIQPAWFKAGRFLDTPYQDWEDALAHNLEAVVYLMQATSSRLEAMKQGGRILLLSHVSGLMPFAGLSTLGTTQAALKALVKMVALELASSGITVNALALAAQDSRLPLSDSAQQQLHRDTPLPDEANQSTLALCKFLISPQAAHLTGLTLPVDGGLLLTATGQPSPFLS